jgi:hypothetical protein
MPVMGPSYSKAKADEAYTRIVALLAEEYRVLNIPIDHPVVKFWTEHREKALEGLKAAVHGVFLQDCYESF